MSNQIQNLKSQTTKEKIKHLSILFFSLVLTLAVFSQISAAANPKPTYDVGLNKADWLYYKSNNDLTAYLGKKSSTLPTVRYQKGGDYLEFSMNQAVINNQETDISTTTSVSLETNSKQPNTPTLFYRNILDGVDANYQITNIPLKVKEEIVLKNPPAALERSYGGRNSENLTFLFDAETSAKPIKQKDGSIAFFDENDNYLFNLEKPFMIDAKGNRSEVVNIEITPVGHSVSNTNAPGGQTKIAPEGTIFGDSNLERKSGLPPNSNEYSGIKSFVNNLKNNTVDNQKVLDLRGIEPLESWIASQTPHQARPRTKLFYHKENLNPVEYQITLSADSNWLSTATYPVVIDPTVTHNADSNFTGQLNRVADADSTSSTQLESSYPEATKDPYTVLLLHFNEASGSTSNIKDYASTTRVITANGNASTTSAVTQLGMGNSGAFDGDGDYFSMPDSEDWNFGSGDFSIEVWANFGSLPASNAASVAQWGSNDRGWVLVKLSDNATLNFAYSTNGSASIDVPFAWSPLANTWYHIALVRNGTGLRAFVNGLQVGSTYNINVDTLYNSTRSFAIGADSGSPGSFTSGYLDSVRILKGRALTPEEIKAAASRRPYAVYTSPVVDAAASVRWDTVNWTEGGVNTGNGEQPYNTNSLVAQWDFNDTSGTTLTASSSGSCTTACNGALTNFAYTASQDQATTTTGWTANNKKWGAGALMMENAASADYVSVSDPASNVLDPNSADLTIETWIKTNDASAEIFSNNNANGTACTSNGYYLGVDASGYPAFYLDTNGATAGCDASTTSQFKINDGNWHQVAVSVTRGTSAVIYVDGKAAGSDTSVTSYSAITVTGNVFFGGSAGGLDAILDSAHYYSRALSAAEILSNYQAGNIEIQTRSGATNDPNDGTWEAWKPTTGETQLLSMDSDAVNWHSDIMASTTIATSTDTVLKMEGTGSLKIEMGKASSTAGTVALWHMEETGTTTGTYLYDETANNNDATTTGTTVVDGIFGKGRSFDGVDDNLTVPDSANWNMGTGDFSIDAWIKPATVSAICTILGQRPDADNFFAFAFNQNSATGLEFRIKSATVITVNLNQGNTSGWLANNWYHIAVTRRGNNWNLYRNGESIASLTDTDGFSDLAGNLIIGAQGSLIEYCNGTIDEPRILKGRALSPDEIAETYRMGANHHLTRQISAVDMSAQTKLPFWIAADRTGTFLEAMIGESDHSNYELASSTLALSTTTVLYIKGDEIASSTSIKDSSFSGKAITANGNARTSGNGKIGNALYFDGTGDYLSAADSDDWNFGSGDFSIDFWVNYDSLPAVNAASVAQWGANNRGLVWAKLSDNATLNFAYSIDGAASIDVPFVWSPSAYTWYHIALVRNGSSLKAFVDGRQIGTYNISTNTIYNSTRTLDIGADSGSPGSFSTGFYDEVRVIKGTALTADQIRQAYEYGLRSHQITIDFGATLQPSDLISNSTDYNFSLTATTSGLSATTSGLYLGDKIIVKENLGGTEYTAQGTVNAINTTTGAITVPSWDTGSSFPSGNGYSPNATVFKWQREYFDITGAATTTRDAITNLTIRPTNGAGGRTVWLDDFRYNTNYLTASSSSAITSGNNRYLQYRIIASSWDSFVSPFVSAISAAYTSLATMFPPIIGTSGGGFMSF